MKNVEAPGGQPSGIVISAGEESSETAHVIDAFRSGHASGYEALRSELGGILAIPSLRDYPKRRLAAIEMVLTFGATAAYAVQWAQANVPDADASSNFTPPTRSEGEPSLWDRFSGARRIQ